MRRLLLLPVLLILGSCAPPGPVPQQAPAGQEAPQILTDGAPLEFLDYGRFQIWYDCPLGEPHRFTYTVDKDEGRLEEHRNFRVDHSLPPDCKSQHSTGTYKYPTIAFHRGHLAPINQFDDNQQAMNSSNLMTNIVPQLAGHNSITWYRTGTLTQCLRDITPVRVTGGVVFGHEPADLVNDYFVQSHGIATPEVFWKVLLTEDEAGQPKIIGWWIPHLNGLGIDLDEHVRTISEIEALLGLYEPPIDVPEELKDSRPERSWALPSPCVMG